MIGVKRFFKWLHSSISQSVKGENIIKNLYVFHTAIKAISNKVITWKEKFNKTAIARPGHSHCFYESVNKNKDIFDTINSDNTCNPLPKRNP